MDLILQKVTDVNAKLDRLSGYSDQHSKQIVDLQQAFYEQDVKIGKIIDNMEKSEQRVLNLEEQVEGHLGDEHITDLDVVQPNEMMGLKDDLLQEMEERLAREREANAKEQKRLHDHLSGEMKHFVQKLDKKQNAASVQNGSGNLNRPAPERAKGGQVPGLQQQSSFRQPPHTVSPYTSPQPLPT